VAVSGVAMSRERRQIRPDPANRRLLAAVAQ
jgi:hypothetical protein